MQKEFFILIFDYLSNHIYQEVTYTVWRYGEREVYTGTLEKVIPFDQVVIDKKVIPFVGNNIAIEEIRTTNRNRLIYANPQAKGYNIKDSMGIMLAQQEMLGYSVDMEALEENIQKRGR